MEDKWSFLYDYARKAFDDEISRFARLDEKSIKLLTATSFIITAFIALAKWIFSEDQNNHFTIYAYILSGLIFILLCASWMFYFLSLKLTVIPRMPLTEEIFELVRNRNIPTIHVALYKASRNAVDEISLIIRNKSKYLIYGFKCTILAGLMLVLFTGMIVLESGKLKSILCGKTTQNKEVIIMSDKETTQDTTNQQSNNEPDLDVNPPNLQYATEGLDSIPDEMSTVLTESKTDEKK